MPDNATSPQMWLCNFEIRDCGVKTDVLTLLNAGFLSGLIRVPLMPGCFFDRESVMVLCITDSPWEINCYHAKSI